MNFFTIRTTSEKKIIGPAYPQIQTMGGTVNRDSSDSLYNVYPDYFPDFVPNLNYFSLHESSKLTDVLSAAMISYGFIVNDKVKDILAEQNLPPHMFYPATVEHHGVFHNNYYWFLFISDILDDIDYSKTKFAITDVLGYKIEDCNNINASSLLRDLKEILPWDRSVNSDLVFFDKTFLGRYDLFKVPFGNYNTYISERLYGNLQEKGITGFNISASKNISV